MYYAKKGKKSNLVMKLKISKKLLLLATTSTLALTGCGLDSELDNIETVEFESISKEPEVQLSDSENLISYSEMLERTIPENEIEEALIIVDEGEYVKATTTVNIRSNASEDSSKVDLLGLGASAKVIGEENDFYKVEYLGNEGYVSKKYVTPYKREHVDAEPIDAIYFPNETLIYNKYMEAKAVVPELEFAFVYKDVGDMYLVDADGSVGYVDKLLVRHVAEGENYAVVDISDQNVKIMNGKDILVDTPCVTGKPSTPTYTGYFSVWQDWGMRNLVCDGRPWVNVMKKFDNGRGLHDAEKYTEANGFRHGWRDSTEFGGTTYLTNGSHGCVNMPHDAAMETDELIKKGSKVLVKR